MIYDLIIIGGGINGAAIAKDASSRGLSVVLLEKTEIGSGVSTKTSKLAHGGVRYLEQYDFSLIREALQERQFLLDTYPDLVHPLKFLLPIYTSYQKPLWLINLGLYVYDFLAWLGKSTLPFHSKVNKETILSLFPHLLDQGLLSGFFFYDAQMDDTLILMDNLAEAKKNHAEIHTYMNVVDILKEPNGIYKVTGKAFIFEGKTVVNATGAWSENLQKIYRETPDRIVASKGVHIVLPCVHPHIALVLRSPIDGRTFFVLPWKGDSLVGTTDTIYRGDLDSVTVEESDRRYLLESISYYFPTLNFNKSMIISEFAGIRPLVANRDENTDNPSEISRRSQITDSGSGIFTVVGGKYTTHRKVAKTVVDAIVNFLS